MTDPLPTDPIPATAVRFDEPGGPDVLHLVDLEVRAPGPGEVRVAVHAAGVNFIDTYHRSGLYPVPLPFVPGGEGAGVVVDTGPDTSLRPGDRIAWVGGAASYASHTVLAEAVTFPLPAGDAVDLDVAAAVPLQGLTAHYLIDSVYPLGPGDVCLVHAAAGGTGRLLVQMAKLRGATVVATAGGPDKVDLARSAGADHVIDYRIHEPTDALVAEVTRLVGPDAIDVVYDGVGAATFDAGLAVLRPRGTMATFGNASGPVPPVSPLALMPKSLVLTRPNLASFLATPEERSRRWEELVGWVTDGALDVRIGRRAPLAEAADVHRALEARATTGKTLLVP